MTHDSRKPDEARRFDEDEPEIPDAWTLDDFDDLLYLTDRAAGYPLHGGEEPYPS